MTLSMLVYAMMAITGAAFGGILAVDAIRSLARRSRPAPVVAAARSTVELAVSRDRGATCHEGQSTPDRAADVISSKPVGRDS